MHVSCQRPISLQRTEKQIEHRWEIGEKQGVRPEDVCKMGNKGLPGTCSRLKRSRQP